MTVGEDWVGIDDPRGILVKFSPDAPGTAVAQALAAIGGRLTEVLRDAVPGLEGLLGKFSLGAGLDPERASEILKSLPWIEHAEPDLRVSIAATSDDPQVTNGNTWGLLGDDSTPSNVYGSQAADAWATGQIGDTSTVVGIVDTGIDPTHPDLYLNIWLNQEEIPTALFGAIADVDLDGLVTFRDLNDPANAALVTDANANGRIDARDLLADPAWADGTDTDGNGFFDDLYGWDFVDDDNDPFDGGSHGTHVAGTVGAVGGNAEGVAGVSWATQLLGLRFLGTNGSGSLSDAIASLDYFTAEAQASPGQHFVATNNSWGADGYSSSLYDAIVRGANADILFVGAAGNGGRDVDNSPYIAGSYDTSPTTGFDAAIGVAAITSTGGRAGYSNWGDETIELGAPGSSILSTLPGTGYGWKSGTSMATPHVAGAIALYAAADPDASAAEIRAALLDSVAPTGSLSGFTMTGGRLDVEAMLAGLAPPPPPSQTAVIVSATDDAGGLAGTLLDGDATDDARPRLEGLLSGALEPGQRLEILADGAPLGDAQVSGTSWSFTPAADLPDGPVTLTARVVGADGQTGALSAGFALAIDTEAPAIGVDPLETEDTTPRLTGTVDDPEAAVSVQVGGQTLAAANLGDGTWALDLPDPLAPGTYDVAATATDAVGNAATDATADEVTILAPPPPGEPVDVSLVLGQPDTGSYGNSWLGLSDPDGRLTIGFEGTGEPLTLSLTGFDIDFDDEIAVLIDGAPAGYLDAGRNEGYSTHAIEIPAALQTPGAQMVVTLVQTDPTWKWGVSDLLVDTQPAADIELVVGETYPESFGNRWNGLTDADGLLTAAFEGGTADLTLSLTGYDIDTNDEITILLNGAPLGALETGVNNGFSDHEIAIPLSDQAAGPNLLTFVQRDPSWIWGLTDIALAEAGAPVAPSQTAEITGIEDDAGALTGPLAPGDATDDTAPLLSGTLSAPLLAGQSLELLIDGQPAGTAAVSGTTWSFQSPALAEGTRSFAARVVEGGLAGPLSPEVSILVDTTAPAVSVDALSTSDATPTLTGTVDDPEASVSLTLDGATHPAVNLGDGTWQADWPETLAPGLYDVAAIATDAAGNAGADSGTDELEILEQGGELTADIPLVFGVPDAGAYGNGWLGLSDPDGQLTIGFLGTDGPVGLSFTGYDIDFADELSILVNGAPSGDLARGANNAFSQHEILIGPEDQTPGVETVVTLVQTDPSWWWGVSDLLVDAPSAPDVSLTRGVEESGAYGNGWQGLSDPDGRLSLGFEGGADDLVLSLSGYDIDFADEIELVLNGRSYGFLSPGANEALTSHEIAIPAADQIDGPNLLAFVQDEPSWTWGVTDLLIDVA